MAAPYGPPASDVVHKYLNKQSLVPNQGLDSADPDSIPWLLLPQPWRRGGGCERTSPSGIGTRHGVAFPGRGGSGSRRDSGSGTGAQPQPARRARRGSGAGAATRSKGEPAYPMSYIGAGEGLRPLRTPTGESAPLAPPSPPPLPSPFHMTEASMARKEATGKLSSTTARAPPSERKALGWLKSRATPVRHRGFLGGALVRLHRLEPQRRKSSITPLPLAATGCEASRPHAGRKRSRGGVLRAEWVKRWNGLRLL